MEPDTLLMKKLPLIAVPCMPLVQVGGYVLDRDWPRTPWYVSFDLFREIKAVLTIILPQMLNMAKIAWAFDLSAGSDAVNDDIDTAYHDGFLIAPKKFPIKITPRSRCHKEVIMQEYQSIASFWDKYDD
jgi:hypothetical protein